MRYDGSQTPAAHSSTLSIRTPSHLSQHPCARSFRFEREKSHSTILTASDFPRCVGASPKYSTMADRKQTWRAVAHSFICLIPLAFACRAKLLSKTPRSAFSTVWFDIDGLVAEPQIGLRVAVNSNCRARISPWTQCSTWARNGTHRDCRSRLCYLLPAQLRRSAYHALQSIVLWTQASTKCRRECMPREGRMAIRGCSPGPTLRIAIVARAPMHSSRDARRATIPKQ